VHREERGTFLCFEEKEEEKEGARRVAGPDKDKALRKKEKGAFFDMAAAFH